MSATVDGELNEYRRAARLWLEENLEPTDNGIPDFSDFTPIYLDGQRKLQRTLFDGGYAGISWPREYGGQGLSSVHERVFNEEAKAFQLPNLGGLGITTFGICLPTMLTHASPAFLSEHVPRALRGDELWAEFFSEPDAGSDLAGVRTRATRDGDRWLLNGSKIWSSGAYYADYGFCLARTNWDVPKHRGLTWFAVKTDKPGITIRRIRQITGASDFCQEFFDDLELSDDDVIGTIDEGWTVTQTMLVFERRWGRSEDDASGGTAHADRPVHDLARDLRTVAEDLGLQGRSDIRQLLARAQVNDVVQSELGSRIAALGRAGVADPSSLNAYVKLAMGIFGPIRARIGLQIAGLASVAWADDDPAENSNLASTYLSARTQAIAGGTHQMMCNVIGERVLDLPREPSFDRDRPFAEVVRRAAEWSGGSAPPAST